MVARVRTSAVRVLGKSMHTLSGGWMVAVLWLWIAELEQQIVRYGAAPADYGVRTLLGGVIPASLLVCVGLALNVWTGEAPDRDLRRREWWHAFWWAAVPNALLLVTVWVMIQEAR